MAQELEGSRNIIVQEPEWFKNNHGSRTMMAQEPYTVAQNNDDFLFSRLQAISKHNALHQPASKIQCPAVLADQIVVDVGGNAEPFSSMLNSTRCQQCILISLIAVVSAQKQKLDPSHPNLL